MPELSCGGAGRQARGSPGFRRAVKPEQRMENRPMVLGWHFLHSVARFLPAITKGLGSEAVGGVRRCLAPAGLLQGSY